jgi:uncharacterized protein (DUF4213/DUF364 family)
VQLDDGSAGAASICESGCGTPSPPGPIGLPPPGSPAEDALEGLGRRDRSAIGLATANALANRSPREGGRFDPARLGGDVLAAVELGPEDRVAMVGHFAPLVDRIRRRVAHLSIFERAPDPDPGILPEARALEMLPACSVALITATTVINGTCDTLLAAAASCREVVLLGPSTPLVPEIFATLPGRVTLLSGMVVEDAEALLRTIARGGGTREFGVSVAKVNVRLTVQDEIPEG